MLQRRTNVSLGATGWKMRLWLWTWTALAPFSRSLRSSFENTAKLQSLEFNLMDLKCVWASLRVCVTLFATVVHQLNLSHWMIIDLWNHSLCALLICWTACEVHKCETHLPHTVLRYAETIRGCLGSCAGSQAKRHWINSLTGEVQTFLIADVLSCQSRKTTGVCVSGSRASKPACATPGR